MTSCEVCGNEPAKYVCSDCARMVGPRCFQTEGWLCIKCTKKEANNIPPETESNHSSIGSTLLVIAFLMIFAGITLLVLSTTAVGQTGIVVIFPFFFASTNGSGFLLLPAIAIVAIMVILALLSLRKSSEK